MGDEEQLGKYKQEFCGVHKHVDLNEDVANIAMVYVEHDINSKHKDVLAQEKDKLVFNVEDACESDMFTDKDISLQKISSGDSTHWVALVKLDSSSKYGYLQSQLAQCKNLDYMPQTSINVKVEIKLPKHCFNYKCLRHEKVCEEYIEESTYEECILTLAYGKKTRTETKSGSSVCRDWERKCRHERYGRRGYNSSLSLLEVNGEPYGRRGYNG